MTTINKLLQNLTITETSFRDEEPNLNPIIKKMLKDLNIIEQYYQSKHSDQTNKNFVITCIETFNIYLCSCLFDSQTYISYPTQFLNDMFDMRIKIVYFIDYFNLNNLDYNLSFIKDISRKLQDFIYYHYYISGCLI